MDLFNNNNSPPIPALIPNKLGYSYQYESNKKLFLIEVPEGELVYAEHFFGKETSNQLLDYLLENSNNLHWKDSNWKAYGKDKLSTLRFKNIEWAHDQIMMFGKMVYQPRYSAWYGDEGLDYTYSGLTLKAKPWNKGLNYIKEQINPIAQTNFNSVLINWYRDGADYMNWHADNEKELGNNPVIGSVNFGASRRFVLRRIDDKKEKIEFELKHGSLLIMKGKLQHYWQHSVPKTKKIKTDRINLTFRVIK